LSFIRKSVAPPEVKEGEVLTAKVLGVEYPVESSYKDDQGRTKYQVKFRLSLPNGYECNSWMAYYEEPSDRSALGALSIAFMKAIEGPVESVKDVLEGLKKHGSVYVKCSGFREYNEQLYPKFKVVPNKLPPFQKSMNMSKSTPKKKLDKLSEADLDRLSPELRDKVLAALKQ